MLTREIGAGKSTLIRHLVRSLNLLRFQPVYLVQAGKKPRDFYGELLRHLGEKTPFFLEKARQLFYKTLLQHYQQRDRCKTHSLRHKRNSRLINYACTHALLTAKKSDSEVIEAPLITRIIQDSARQKGYAT